MIHSIIEIDDEILLEAIWERKIRRENLTTFQLLELDYSQEQTKKEKL